MAVLIANNATGRLASTVAIGQTILSLQAGQGASFPSPTGGDWFPVTAIKPNGDLEIMRCTARSGDVLTVSRGMESTSEREWAPGDRVELRYTRQAIEWSMVPKGGIILWSGAIANIPEGWALCNGSNGTPDLRNRFVVGAGSTYAVGATGGADSVTLTTDQMPEHNHSASTGSDGSHNHSGTANSAGSHSHTGSTNNAGSHSHSFPRVGGSGSTLAIETFPDWAFSNTSGVIAAAGAHTHSLSINSGGAHTHSLSIDSNGAHTHSVSVGNTGGGQSHENRPPYYALAYIMKL